MSNVVPFAHLQVIRARGIKSTEQAKHHVSHKKYMAIRTPNKLQARPETQNQTQAQTLSKSQILGHISRRKAIA